MRVLKKKMKMAVPECSLFQSRSEHHTEAYRPARLCKSEMHISHLNNFKDQMLKWLSCTTVKRYYFVYMTIRWQACNLQAPKGICIIHVYLWLNKCSLFLGFISHCLSIDRIKSINNVTNKDKHLRKFGTFFTWQLFKTLPNLVKRVSICVNSIQPTYIKNNIRVTAVEWSIVISGPCGNLKFLKQKNTDLSNKQTKLLDWAGLWCLQPLQQHFQPNR